MATSQGAPSSATTTTKKSKPQAISLNDFVGKAEENWAEMPSQPVLVQENMPESCRSSADHQMRPPDFSKIVPGGPYVAFVGNFPFEVTEEHLAAFFDGLPFKSIKIALNYADNTSRGYAYVEFATEQALRDAVEANGANFFGRKLRIDVADVKERPSKFGGAGGGFSSRPRNAELTMKREKFETGDTPGDWRSASISTSTPQPPKQQPSNDFKRRDGGGLQAKSLGSRYSKDDFVFKRRED
jgi:RNA recognition motif-containing protein